MFKRLKSIIATMMAIAMLASVCCTPAMAAESTLISSNVLTNMGTWQ